MKYLNFGINALVNGWNWFWFDSRSEDDLSSLAGFRIFFSAVICFLHITRTSELEFFYSDRGILPVSFRSTVDMFLYRPTILTHIDNMGFTYLLHGLFLVSLLAMCFGIFTRFSAMLAYLLHMTFMNRNMLVNFGADTISTFYLLYLCFANSGGRYSLDSKLGWNNPKQGWLSHIAFRLMQLQLCVIYAYSGLEKMKGSLWWDGTAMWHVSAMSHFQRWDMSFVAHFPFLLSLMVYTVLAWEIYFPALVWLPKWRLPMLAFGALMHLNIVVFLGLPSFGLMMISIYVLFLKKNEVNYILNFFHKKFRLTPSHS